MQRENNSLEYKMELSKTYLKTVSAFANYNDGEIIFGVTNDYKIDGIKNPKETCLKIENQINDSIKPRPDYTLKVNNNNTVSLFVKRGNNTPYKYNGKAYKRNDSSSIEVDEIEEKRLILSGINMSFEELSVEDKLEFSYLKEKLSKKLELNEFNIDILKCLSLYSSKTGYNNATKLLADKNDFPGFDIVIFGESINILKKRITLSGESILKQYYDTIEIYKNEYIVEKIENGFREKIELIPFDAFREAIANALVHRTWDIKANSKIEMHPNKIIVSSPGGLIANMSTEDYIKGNYSYLRNPIVANVFRRLNIIEAFATGIKRINESYKDSLAKPIYDVTSSSISVTLPQINKINISKNEGKVLNSMSQNFSYSRIELEKITCFSKDIIIRTLNSLVSKGLIEKSGKAKATFYIKK